MPWHCFETGEVSVHFLNIFYIPQKNIPRKLRKKCNNYTDNKLSAFFILQLLSFFHAVR
jgi:hypothetical protein